MISLGSELLAAIADNAPDGIVLVDASGTIVFASQRMEVLFGYPADELIGKSVELLVPERHRQRHIGLQQAFHARPSTRAMGSGLELTGRRADGSEFPVEISLSPIPAEHGVYITAVVRDVSDRRALEDARRHSEERYRLLAEHARDIIFRLRLAPPPARMEYVSPSSSQITGYSAEDHYADPGLLLRISDPASRPLLERLVSEPETVPSPLQIRVHRRDGAPIWLEQQFNIVRDDDGRPIAIEGIARDITQRLEEQEERQQLRAEAELQEERERIARDLHDGVMQAIYGAGLTLADARGRLARAPDEAAAGIDEVLAGLRNVIGDIRRYVMDLPLERIDGAVGPLLRALVDDLRARTTLRVSLELPPVLPTLSEDVAGALYHVTQEALSNVRRHAQAATVAVRLDDSTPGLLVLDIRDDGIGFDPSVPAGEEHLGLRNMRARTDRLGGRINVESAPGQGTRLVLRLPVG